MTYPEAIEFLYGLRLFGAKFGLENTRQLAERAGRPQDRLRFIHVAGTNGKGSTCALLESIYRAAGYRTGLFTSPHLVSFRERLQVNRQLISEADVVRQVETLRPWLAEFPAEHHPTFFEVVTIMALRHFAEAGCQVVIWETGMGGRLDATNIVTPLASVITNIGYDHQQWLGDTLPKIAAEKAGIIKPGIPVFTTTNDSSALAVIEQTAGERASPLLRVAPGQFGEGEIGLLGEHQQTNAALAVAVVRALQAQLPVPAAAVAQGLATVSWPGRLQLISRPGNRWLLVDGAHNAEGVDTLVHALKTQFAGHQPAVIFGALQDKKWPELCRQLGPVAGSIHTVPVASERTASAEDLAAAFRATVSPNVPVRSWSGLQEALSNCQSERFVVVTGSLYLVGEALELTGHSPAGSGERGLNDWNSPSEMDKPGQ